MLSDRTVYLNGKFVEWEKATVPIMSHSFSRGSAIFEVMSFHETDKGPAVFRLDEHIKRLFRTAELLSMELPLSKEAFQKAVLTTVKANHLDQGMVKVVCYYHEIAFEILSSQKALDVCIVAVDPTLDFGGLSFSPSESISACISRWRKLHPETVPIEAKVAANYLNGMMAKLEAGQRGFDIAIMLDTEGFVAEGSLESLFFVRDGVLTTSTLGTVLQGITRKSLLQAASRSQIKTAEKRIRPEALMEADEIFFSSSGRRILPVNRLETRTIQTTPGPITKRLMTILDEICSGRSPRFKRWLFPIG
jgi:branched-chain amino acid aminotransferase